MLPALAPCLAVGLDELVRAVKHGDDAGAAGIDAALADSIQRAKRFKETDLDVDAECVTLLYTVPGV
jgi:hypothetical protein